jgi:hypothetical protein
LRPSDLVADKITAIYDAIQALPGDLDFSNPASLTTLPFPSLLKVPFQRFDYRVTDLCYFQYMGRSKFTELYDWTQRDSFLRGFGSIYLYGSSGSGKSHILAALACQFIREGKRVVYIPDCGQLLKNFELDIRNALSFAFHDSQQHLKTIRSAPNLEQLFKFCEERTDIYFIVDQLNALELDSLDGSSNDKKKEVTINLKRITKRHKYIFSASANEKSYQLADSKQSGVLVLPIHGGMNRVSRSLNTAPYNAYVLLEGNGLVVFSLCRQNSAIKG